MKHESQSAEKLALAWHGFGVVASVFWCLSGIAGAIEIEPVARVLRQFSIFYYSAVTSAFVAAAGAFWHLWAMREHRAKIKKKRR